MGTFIIVFLLPHSCVSMILSPYHFTLKDCEFVKESGGEGRCWVTLGVLVPTNRT